MKGKKKVHRPPPPAPPEEVEMEVIDPMELIETWLMAAAAAVAATEAEGTKSGNGRRISFSVRHETFEDESAFGQLMMARRTSGISDYSKSSYNTLGTSKNSIFNDKDDSTQGEGTAIEWKGCNVS